jgi:hypothetical protein
VTEYRRQVARDDRGIVLEVGIILNPVSTFRGELQDFGVQQKIDDVISKASEAIANEVA